MQTKNVYIAYPAGYHGSYVSWAIAISDKDSFPTTVKNPINHTASNKLGGAGTSHLHMRVPTHQDISDHRAWQVFNAVDDYRCYISYVVNFNSYGNLVEIRQIFERDPEAIVIAIHDDNDEITRSYGRINNVIKWPTFMAATTCHRTGVPYRFTDEELAILQSIDFYNCADNLFLRNLLIKNIKWPGGFGKVDRKELQFEIDGKIKWFNVRSAAQPHEVNHSQYADLTKVNLDTQVFDLSIKDIVSNHFPATLNKILVDSQLSTDFNVAPVAQVQQEYINAQSTMQWFPSCSHWEETGELDDFLQSHVVIQAQIINLILKKSNVIFVGPTDYNYWYGVYFQLKGSDWPDIPKDPHLFYTLPDWVKKELLAFGYVPVVQATPNRAILELFSTSAWETMTLSEINEIYQSTKD